MKNESKFTKASLILGFAFVILFTHIPVVYTLLYHELTAAPSAVDGSIDAAMFSPDRTTVLDGEWEFYWKRLIVTDEQHDNNPDFIIGVPDYWTRYKIDGNWLPAEGFGTIGSSCADWTILNLLQFSYPISAALIAFS